MRIAPALPLCSLLLVASGAAQSTPDEQAAIDHFEAKVRPVLVEHCIECHSGGDPKGGLRLDSTAGIAAGAHGESIFVSGDLESSSIVEALRYDDVFIAMPPTGKLADDEIAAVERWIELGAHLPASIEISVDDTLRWCFRPPADAPPPTVAGAGAVDSFLFAALEARGVAPSPAADRRSWLRRVTFDLTGLPPTPAQLAAFLADENEGAYDRVVDRLLADPAFGERWARRWLDLVRYAETKAHEFDYPIPNAHRYRDYIIRAFDADVPYDRLVIELLAGDLVQAPRLDATGTWDESILGTGAWQLGEEVHSPVEPRGDQTDRIAHQVEVLSKSVLALGAACARCHDHKFDPISAEDYHGLAGFALSTAPRQVRFESNDNNLAVARDLEALLGSAQPIAREAVAAALEAEADGLAATLLDARERLDAEVERIPLTADAVSALDALASQQLTTRLDLLVEDFDGESFDDCALAPWTREGDAFLDRPIRKADIPSNQPGLVPRGLGCVNSYAGHPDARDYSADSFTGTLTSGPFPITRRYLHFLVDGGDQDTVRVELVREEDGEVLRKVSGQQRNELSHAVWDLQGLEETRVRIRFVDEHEGGWGQIGGDHFVLSDDGDAGALDRARSIGQWRVLLGESGAPAHGNALEWSFALAAGGAHGSTGHWLEWLDVVGGDRAPLPSGVREVVDYGTLSGPRWITNGPGFGVAPRAEGDVVLDVDDTGERPKLRLASLSARAAAVYHPTWNDLTLEDSSTYRNSDLNWVQAGRTLVSPAFDLEHGRVAHLVRGSGKMLLSIASHKLVAGPLHTRSIRSFDTHGEWKWIVQDVPSGAGLAAHLELTATGGETCEIATTVEVERNGALSAPADLGWVLDRFEDEAHGAADSKAARAAFVERRLLDAAALVRDGGVAGRALSDGERATLYAIAEDVARTIPRVRERIARDLDGLAGAMGELEDRRMLGSRLAPAALDLDGRDERVLDRGSWRAPRAPAPRRIPRVLRSSDEPLARDGEGSGRLALARALIESEAAIVPRVWVNRTWHALFGRGLVETTDDFGAMGAKPTHPELLDRLTIDFVRDGWSTKRLVRRLVLTDAYRRATAPSASARALDPTNELLGHMRVRRLEAEEVRDTLLAVSGELDRTMFGPSVPIHLTEFMTGRGRPDANGPLDGDRRRSIYIEVRRNFPHPLLAVFDQPSPSTCHGRRTSANVPAQALALWNDPFVEGRALALASSLDRSDLSAALEHLWLRALGRRPRPAERDFAIAYIAHADLYDLAPWVDLAHTLFNAKEFLFLE